MERMDIDLYLAGIERTEEAKDRVEESTEDIKKNALKKLERVRKEINQAVNLNLERKDFFDLFSMCLPLNLIQNQIKEENLIMFRSQSEHLALVIKEIDYDESIDLESIKKYYQEQMLRSKQQTQFDQSGSRKVNGIEVFYFTAAHSMPEQKQIDYIILFTMCSRTIILDFNMRESNYSFWKIVMNAMIGSLRQEGKHGM
ncbi:hypothetical protein [Clostridium sp. Marseille-P2415]|uniref:hypothetical protein n=1 Tax=Clostridium sp. Marseille-P2415 TaxID=1805471 RepID=UPI00111584F6|nr:hypothetical protein [Clostridium sp. Marseille-P2415]